MSPISSRKRSIWDFLARRSSSTSSMQKSGVFVIGMHRSGTSALMRVLVRMGAFAGSDDELTGANSENPHGFFERRDCRRICDAALHGAGADWWKVSAWSSECLNTVAPELDEAISRLTAIVSRSPVWALKEPRLCMLFPLLQQKLPDSVCVIPYRHPLEVAKSLNNRNGFPISAGLALWEFYMVSALTLTKKHQRIFVSHHALMQHPIATIRGMHAQLVALGLTALQPLDDKQAADLIDPALYRHQLVNGSETLPQGTDIRTLWRSLESGEVAIDIPEKPHEAVRQVLDAFEWGQSKVIELQRRPP